jgi:hypothetical protein
LATSVSSYMVWTWKFLQKFLMGQTVFAATNHISMLNSLSWQVSIKLTGLFHFLTLTKFNSVWTIKNNCIV